MENIDLVLKKLKAGELNIKKLAAETGIPGTRMYKWKDRDSDISLADARKLSIWATKNLDKSLLQKEEGADSKDKTIADLAYSTRRLADNNTAMVNMHKEFLERIFPIASVPGAVSPPSQEKEIVSDPNTEQMQGKSENGSGKSQKKQKDSVKN